MAANPLMAAYPTNTAILQRKVIDDDAPIESSDWPWHRDGSGVVGSQLEPSRPLQTCQRRAIVVQELFDGDAATWCVQSPQPMGPSSGHRLEWRGGVTVDSKAREQLVDKRRGGGQQWHGVAARFSQVRSCTKSALCAPNHGYPFGDRPIGASPALTINRGSYVSAVTPRFVQIGLAIDAAKNQISFAADACVQMRA